MQGHGLNMRMHLRKNGAKNIALACYLIHLHCPLKCLHDGSQSWIILNDESKHYFRNLAVLDCLNLSKKTDASKCQEYKAAVQSVSLFLHLLHNNLLINNHDNHYTYHYIYNLTIATS